MMKIQFFSRKLASYIFEQRNNDYAAVGKIVSAFHYLSVVVKINFFRVHVSVFLILLLFFSYTTFVIISRRIYILVATYMQINNLF